MGSRLRINCKKVYETGVDYTNISEEIIKIQGNLKNSYQAIENNWSGVDSHNFLVSLDKHINDLEQIYSFLNYNGELLKKNALEHGTIDNNFATKMERSDLDD